MKQNNFLRIKYFILILLIAFLLSAPFSHASLSDGLIRYYGMDSGNYTQNDVDLKNNLTINGVATNATGKLGSGLSIPGADVSYFSATTTGLPDGNKSRTMNGWFNWSDNQGGASHFSALWGAISPGIFGIVASLNTCGGNTNCIGIVNGVSDPSSTQSATNNTWFMVTVTYTGGASGNETLYINGVNVKSDIVNMNTALTTDLRLGRGYSPSQNMKGRIDELGIWNRSLNQTEITQLYNSGIGINYSSITAGSQNILNNTIIFLNQTPANITTTNLYANPLTFTFNYSNSTVFEPTYLNYTVTDAAISCVVRVNGTCITTTNQYLQTGIKTNATSGPGRTFTFTVDENDIYSATYNINHTVMENTPHLNFTLGTQNDYVSTEILNFSNTTYYNYFEVYAANLAASGTANLHVCNSTYAFSSPCATSPYCTSFGTITTTSFNHSENNSLHNIINIPLVNGFIGSVKVTPTMYFMVRGTPTDTNVGYITNQARPNATRTTSNNGNSWTPQTWTLDAHVHQMGPAPSGIVSACGNFTSLVPNGTVCSSQTTFAIAPTAIPPSPPVFIRPADNELVAHYINITYTAAIPSTNLSNISRYTLYLLNNDSSYNLTILNSTTSLSYLWDYLPYNLSITQYQIMVVVNDTLGLSTKEISELFNVTTNAVLNVTVKDVVTNASIQNFTVLATNISAGINANVSATSGSVLVDVIKGYNYYTFVDAAGYAYDNKTLQTDSNTTTYATFYLSPTNSIFIYAFDETTLQLLNTINTTVTLTSGVFYLNQTSGTGSFLFQNLTAGTWTVVVSPTGYSPKTYFVTVTNRGTYTLNTFLGQTTTSIVFKLKDSVTGNLIPDATFTVQKLIGANYVTVAQTTTDAFGQAVFNLLPLTQYQFVINAPDYAPKSGLFNTVIASYIVLLDANNTQTYQSYLDVYSYKISPDVVMANSTSFSLTTNCPSGCLNWFAVVVTYNGTNYTQNVTGSPSGGIATVTLDFSSIAGMVPISAYYYVKAVGLNDTIVIGRSWVLYGGFGRTNYTLINFLDYYGSPSSPIGMETRGIIVVIVAAGLAVLAGMFLGGSVAMMMAATVFLIAGLFGWLSIGITIVTVGALIGLLLLGGRN